MQAWALSTRIRGTTRCVYHKGVPAVGYEPEPKPDRRDKPPSQLTPLPFTLSTDGRSIVFDMHYRKGVHMPIELGGRRIDLAHPLALTTKIRTDNGFVRAMVRVACPCGFTRHLQTGEWARGRACQKCSRKQVKREMTGIYAKDENNVMPLFINYRSGR